MEAVSRCSSPSCSAKACVSCERCLQPFCGVGHERSHFCTRSAALVAKAAEAAAKAAAEAAALASRAKALDEKEKALDALASRLEAQRLRDEALLAEAKAKVESTVLLNIGGTRFSVSRTTLLSEPDTYFSVVFSGRHDVRADADGAVFVDRSPAQFDALLAWLRGKALPNTAEARWALLDEAHFYAVASLVSALEAALDGRARVAECVAAALAAPRAAHADELAARAYFAARLRGAAVPSPLPEALLLRPFADAATKGTFRYAADADSDLCDVADADGLPGKSPLILAAARKLGAKGKPSVVHSRDAYALQLSLFTRGALSFLSEDDWRGVLLAGGAALAPLLPLPPKLRARMHVRQGQLPPDDARWDTLGHYHSCVSPDCCYFFLTDERCAFLLSGGLESWGDGEEEADGEPMWCQCACCFHPLRITPDSLRFGI